MANGGKKSHQKGQTEAKKETKSNSSQLPLTVLVLSVIVLGVAVFVYFQQSETDWSLWKSLNSFQSTQSKTTDTNQDENSKSKKKKKSLMDPNKVFTAEELNEYDGSDPTKPIYIALFGEVFDVTKGGKHYAKDGSYNGFAGRDGTRAFVTGEFNPKGLRPDVDDLAPRQVSDIWDWKIFYRNHKDYFYVGKLHGHYYDEKGEPTEHLAKIKETLKEAERLKTLDDEENQKWPGCNSKWDQVTGGEIWCSDMSGGIKRDWVGVPRKRLQPGKDKQKCVCVREELINDPTLEAYPDCSSTSASCKIEMTLNKV